MDKENNNLTENISWEAYVSSLKHELRNMLGVIQEGTSQVLDGLGDNDCQKCYKILTPVLKNIKELDRLIDQSLDASRFKSLSGKSKDDTRAAQDDLEIFKKELIGVISHVVRTPLTVIKEGLALILDEIPGKLNPKQKEIVTTVKNNTDRLINSIERVLDSSWQDTVKTIGGEAHYKSIIKDDQG